FLLHLKSKGKIPENLDIDKLCKEKGKYFLEIIKNGINIFNGVFETIEFLKEKKLKIAAASNSKKVFVKSVLEYSNLIKFFDFFVAREDVENPKPASDIYEKVVKLMGLKKENVVVFEDSEVGIEAAKKAGLFCIAVASTQEYDKLKKADVIIEKIEKRKIEEILRGERNENI
ncbi:HAD family phosphatase, partial [bacterium]|nr:HAD family phosphatase [bacterium]